MITVQTPNSYDPERRYILSLLLGEFLGLDIQIQSANRKDVQITTDDGRKLLVAEGLFSVPEDQWLRSGSLPRQPLKIWDLRTAPITATVANFELPVIYGKDPNSSHFLTISDSQINLGLDVFGAAFFMLTRYEEVVKPVRDKRSRFPADASLAYQEGFIERPIINEYLEILWACLKQLWPGLVRKTRHFQIDLTHDVDRPLCTVGKTFTQVLKSIAGDVVKRKKPALAQRRFRSVVQVKRGNVDADLCNTFDFIMDLSEKQSLRSSFYFITDQSAGEIDGTYSITDPWIKELLKKIHVRGHELGLHPSYNTFRNPQQIRREFEILLQVAEAENIHQETWGGRQHFLRWEAPTTWQAYEDAGLCYDSTLTFADWAGFRCGVCYEFRAFNLEARRPLRVRERPLMVMDRTVLDKQYMHLTSRQALQKVDKLRERCRPFNGEFTLLWHNDFLIDKQTRESYRAIVERLTKG
jgi:hypothetical protein